MTNHVELRNVTKQFGSQKAVNQVDLVLKAGESVGMAGHNGAGKSTIMKLILGLITPTEGEVMLLGERTGSKAGALLRSQIGYLPETVALHPSLTGIETMDFYAKLKKQPLSKNRELLERVGISQAARRRVGTYSKGMRQRLALAQALLGEPKVLLFDEPTTGLDPASRQMFYEVVRELNGRGATVLLRLPLPPLAGIELKPSIACLCRVSLPCVGIVVRTPTRLQSLLFFVVLSSKTQWLSGLYYADFISFYSPTQLCGGGTTKSNSNELPISVPLSFE